MPPRNVFVIGSANIDLVTRVPRCPKPGESLIGSSFATITGGKGANQAVAAARLGARVTFAGCVGADAFGQMQRDALAAEGIGLDHLKTTPEAPTGTAIITVGDDGQNSIVVTPGANYALHPRDIAALAPALRAADALLLQLEVPLDTTAAALRLAREAGTLTILDAGPAQALPAELIALADIISPNETEAHALTGVEVTDLASAERAAQRLLELGARAVVLKLGARGALLHTSNTTHHAAPFTVTPVDTTAAGDAFTAALALRWGTAPAAEVLRFANAVGALATTRHGAQPAMPTHDEVERFLNVQ